MGLDLKLANESLDDAYASLRKTETDGIPSDAMYDATYDRVFAGCDMSESWSYGGFGEFRRRLAMHLGVTLDDMAGFCRTDDSNIAGLTGRAITRPIPWPQPGRESTLAMLVPLLNHSDADGELTPEECALVSSGLARVSMVASPLWGDDRFCSDLARLRVLVNEAASRGLFVVFR